MLRTAAMKVAGKYDEACDNDKLHEERRFDKRMTCSSFAFSKTLVGRIRSTPTVQCLDNGGDEAKCGEHPPRMEWCMVRHVVQNATEDVIVLQLEQRSYDDLVRHQVEGDKMGKKVDIRSSVSDADTGNVYIKIIVVPSTVDSKDEANSEQQAAEWK